MREREETKKITWKVMALSTWQDSVSRVMLVMRMLAMLHPRCLVGATAGGRRGATGM